MQTTKQQLLELLKRTGSVTVEEAAGALSVASMTARQHLVGLERDGLVRAQKVKRPTGRPHYLYSLTPKGEETFPSRYDLFAQLLLEEISTLEPDLIVGLTGDQKRALFIQRTAERCAAAYRFRVEGRRLEEKVAAVTDVLQVIGGFAEWVPTERGYEIRDYNCIFSRIVPDGQNGCEWHVHLLTHLLDWPVHHEHAAEGRCCRYIIETEAADD